jgi:alkylation response protein AidB-like acyl-CoA dehydrogenase
MACDITSDGIQILVGKGYMKDYGQEKRFRDAKHAQTLLDLVPMKAIHFITKINS